MVKKVGFKQNWGEVAPAPLISRRKSSTCPRLETILEEGYENHAVFSKKGLDSLRLNLPVVSASRGFWKQGL
ncbi:hypothetical protein DITRI_Ditri19aG0068700 [Diplodiscus trichospermus]